MSGTNSGTGLPTLAITGSTGSIGGRVAAQLAELEMPQRLIVRDVASAPDLEHAVPVSASSYGDADGMQRALRGAHTLFFVSGRESVDRLEQHMTVVDAAIESGVERIVYLSFVGAHADSVFTLGRQHWATEQRIRDSGIDFTFMRSSLYADFVPFFVGDDGSIRGPAGAGSVSWVSRDDIADTIVAVLAEPGHDNAIYDNTGPEALSLADTAAIVESVVGRPIAYEEETMDQAWASRRKLGAPDWEIEGWITSYTSIAAGEMAAVSQDVLRLTGHRPMALEPFLRENPELWAHLVS